MSTTSISAIILCAGLSSRMGAFKPLLPLGKETIIKQVVTNIRQTGIQEIHLVLGYRASDVVSHVEDMAVNWVVNQDFQEEMLTSVQIGVSQLSPDTRAFFLLPVDIPLIRKQTFTALMEANAVHPQAILTPSFNDKNGHPPLIPKTYADIIVGYRGDGGLRGCLQLYEKSTLKIPVADEGILLDMDTPDQYEQIKRRYQNWLIPSIAECLAMLSFRFKAEDPMIQHAKTVAGLAQQIAAKLDAAGYPINSALVTACAFLHDIGKGIKGHAKIGADMLVNFGYPQIAAIVAAHMDLEFHEQDAITEKEVLFLADKKISGTRIMALDERLSTKLKQFASNPAGRAAAERRLRTAMQIEQRIETIIGGKI